METLIVFSIVFIPAGWAIWQAIRSTRDTIGTRSPLKVSRVYKTTASSFFLESDMLFVSMFFFIGSMVVHLALFGYLAPTQDYPELTRVGLFLFGLIPLSFSIAVLALDLNHLNYVNGVVIETFPEEHEIEITFDETTLRLKEGDIKKILVYHNNAHKFPLGYVEHHLSNGDYFILPFKTAGLWVIQEYFKKIPVAYSVRRFPFIKSPEQLQKISESEK